jgi:hypothetical protein
MCKKSIYSVSIFLILCLIGAVEAQDMEIGVTTEPPVIDGEVDELWLDASTQNMVPADDPANASGSWRALYDSDNLYVMVDIIDDALVNDSASSWQDDSVEFYFDGDNSKDGPPLSGDNRQYTFGWTTDEVQGTNIATEGVEHAQVDTDTGWRIEMKLPWLSLQGAEPMPGDLIGIDCFYNDDDDGGDSREVQIFTFASDGTAWSDAAQWGTAVLGELELGRIVVFEEDFEGVTLGPNVDESLAGEAVWTDTPPEGWSVDESGIPGIGMDATDGVTEWAGWAFTDKAWWIQAAEDQDRSLFELGSGTVAVADPDEWDDDERLPIPIATDPYDTWLTTPSINIAAVIPGTLELKFDSSWRPEFDDDYHQTASITASFDGGDPVEVLLWESDEASANFKPYAVNETVTVALPNPAGATSVVLTFGLFDAGNDWWWAIDNVEVSGEPIPEPVQPSIEGLVVFYPLDGDADNAAGDELNGSLVGEPNFVEGKVGMAIDLDGDGDYVDCGTNETLNGISEALTASAWINIRSITHNWMAVMAKGETAWRISINNGTLGLHFGFTGGDRGWQAANSNSQIALDEWHHVAATYDNEEGAKIYVDGLLDGSNPDQGGIPMNEAPLLIGENPEAAGRFFDGLIDEVTVYERTLSAAEVRYLAGFRPGPEAAFAFGSRDLECVTFNNPTVRYTMVLHESPESVQYDPERGYGYEVLYPTDSPYGDRGGYGIFGPFDDSPNGRNEFPDECPEELYDSFIGAKNFLDVCNADVTGDANMPCDPPEGIIFRVDVPNGFYRFVGAFGEADNLHTHRILAEDGGSGPPENIGPNHVVLVNNHDQAQYAIGEAGEDDDPGDGVFARVGFDGLIPPPGDRVFPSPQFVDMDENGMPTDAGPNSPILEVTQGYIRIHQLQGNSNNGPGGEADPNGGDIVILELWKIELEQ